MSQYFYGQYNQFGRYVGAPAAGPAPHQVGARPGRQVRAASTGGTSVDGRSGLAGIQSLADAYATLWLQPGAPEPIVKAAYRALAARHHPDAGGDTQTMARINQAYEVITRHLR